MKDFNEGEDPLDRSNVVAFPMDAKLARARQAYWRELERFEWLEYEGKHPRLNKLIVAAYFALLTRTGLCEPTARLNREIPSGTDAAPVSSVAHGLADQI